MSTTPNPFVSRGGLKLRHALDVFGIDVTGLRCVDLGCSTGGFTDCLLQAGAAHVTAVDTAYGVLAWKLRQDPRVRVIERRNALHVDPAAEGFLEGAGVDLVVMDLGWTPQRLALPAAVKWLRPSGRIITLIKPHYELEAGEKGLLNKGVLDPAQAERVTRRTVEAIPGWGLGLQVEGLTKSPILGGATRGKKEGNQEHLLHAIISIM